MGKDIWGHIRQGKRYDHQTGWKDGQKLVKKEREEAPGRRGRWQQALQTWSCHLNNGVAKPSL